MTPTGPAAAPLRAIRITPTWTTLGKEQRP